MDIEAKKEAQTQALIADAIKAGKLSEQQASMMQAEIDANKSMKMAELALSAAQGNQSAEIETAKVRDNYVLEAKRLGISEAVANADFATKWGQLTLDARKAADAAKIDTAKVYIANDANEIEKSKTALTALIEKAKQRIASEGGYYDREIKRKEMEGGQKSGLEKALGFLSPSAEGIGAIGSLFSKGGVVPGQPVVKGDSPKNDIVPAQLSPGEIVIPRSVVQGGREGMMEFLEQKLAEAKAMGQDKPTATSYTDLLQARRLYCGGVVGKKENK
jgi:hypothetical protein